MVTISSSGSIRAIQVVEYLCTEVNEVKLRKDRIQYSPCKRPTTSRIFAPIECAKRYFPRVGGDDNVHQTVRLAIYRDLVEHFALGNQERVVVKTGFGPDLLCLWGRSQFKLWRGTRDSAEL